MTSRAQSGQFPAQRGLVLAQALQPLEITCPRRGHQRLLSRPRALQFGLQDLAGITVARGLHLGSYRARGIDLRRNCLRSGSRGRASGRGHLGTGRGRGIGAPDDGNGWFVELRGVERLHLGQSSAGSRPTATLARLRRAERIGEPVAWTPVHDTRLRPEGRRRGQHQSETERQAGQTPGRKRQRQPPERTLITQTPESPHIYHFACCHLR